MLESLKKDALVSFLCEKCSLSEAQLDTILADKAERKLKNKIANRDKRKLSAGAFVRTLRQGQSNIEASMYTLLLLAYLGLTSPREFDRLSSLGVLISKVRASSPTPEEVQRLIDAIQDFAEGFSQRRKLIV
jgi:ABC-type bacteriocin/lantibiotic exporter with double-glycine peptidase domain